MLQRNWYDTPLYYDIVFDSDTAREADFLEALHARYGTATSQKSHKRVLEPACGSGRLVAEMAARDWQVSGFDGNEYMLQYARERLTQRQLKAQLWQDDMAHFQAPGKKAPLFDLAHCLVSSFKYLLTEDAAVGCLQSVAHHLKPGGLFILGLHLTDYANTRQQHERWVAQRDGIHVVCNTRTWPADRRSRIEPIRTRLQITHGQRSHRQETHWPFRTYNAAEIHTLLAQVPKLELIDCYDFTYDLNSPRLLDDSYSDIILVLQRSTSAGS
jgi:SAM-dependent methyltransferase